MGARFRRRIPPEGLRPEALGRILKNLPIDLVDVSSGGVTGERVDAHPGYQIPFSEKIREISGLPTAAGGLITEARQAEAVLEEEKADLIYFGRELFEKPPFSPLRCQGIGESKCPGRNNTSARKYNTGAQARYFYISILIPKRIRMIPPRIWALFFYQGGRRRSRDRSQRNSAPA